MKKFFMFALLSTLLMSANVYAKEEYEVFNKGDFVGLFYNQANKEAGTEITDGTRNNIIIGDDNKDNEYVKTLVVGVGRVGNGYTEDEPINFSPETFFNTTGPYPISTLIDKLKDDNFQDTKDSNGNGPFFKNFSENGSVGLISLEEMIDVFDAKEENGKYVIDISKKINNFDIKTMFVGLAKDIKREVDQSNEIIKEVYNIDFNIFYSGFYTSTIVGTKIYAVNFRFTGEELTGMDITLEDLPETNDYDLRYFALVPTAYYRKDLVKEEVVEDPKTDEESESPKTDSIYACYVCNDEYVWEETGKQADSCKLSDTITDKNKCVKPVETGVNTYIIEFVAVIAIASSFYVLSKKYNLFKKI